ncbi:MAG: hypothetical protein M1818_002902 [Claussenomyces sp. TS43310]|nr:MAG: hypothetical protein M1818_002902 [Claussenomyces sp. TS43310]
MKPESADLVDNPFIKKINRSWEVEPPKSLEKSISPPRVASRRRASRDNDTVASRQVSLTDKDQSRIAEGPDKDGQRPNASTGPLRPAAVEAGEVKIRDHLEYFSTHLAAHVKPEFPLSRAVLSISDFVDLYRRNQNPQGHHFVVHQHDHPLAGTHYDLRLQFSETSSISLACMYGLPGNVNSKRLNRNATETRVHNVWNHLIETSSHSTGSLLIWDTGEYEVLPYRSKRNPDLDPDTASSDSNGDAPTGSDIPLTEPEKLFAAFKNRKIKLRLHGTKLPRNYTLSLRLSKADDQHKQPKKPLRKRRRKITPSASKTKPLDETPPSSDAEGRNSPVPMEEHSLVPPQPQKSDPASTALERELQEQEDEQVRRTNAYPGATNSIHSIHQRRWFLSMDRPASGFYPASRHPMRWARRRDTGGEMLGFEPFVVSGRDGETSVVTGRTADEVMADDGVVGYVGRKGWRAVTE